MTNQEFIYQIISEYKKARELIFGNAGFSIKRGMSHSISGIAEDLFSIFIAKQLNDNSLKFFVDKPISVRLPGLKRAKTFKPDLFIINGDKLTHYFDIKMDLGWNRYLENYLIEKNEFVKKITQLSATGEKVWFNDNGEIQNVSISKKLSYQIVVLSSGNINLNILNKNFQLASELEFVNMYLLTGGVHLNMYRADAINELVINDSQFENLVTDTKRLLA